MYQSQTYSQDSASFLTNFPFSSRKNNLSERKAVEPHTYITFEKDPIYQQNQYLINGVNFYSDTAVINREVETVEDAYTIKGEYFYIRKGTRVLLKSTIGEYAEVLHNQRTGYVPSYVLKFL